LASVMEERAAAPKPAGGSALWGNLKARVQTTELPVEERTPPVPPAE
jgi:hypothetical protein